MFSSARSAEIILEVDCSHAFETKGYRLRLDNRRQMTKDEAQTIYEKYCDENGRTPTSSSAEPQPDGSWRFIESEGPEPNGIYEDVVVRADGTPFPSAEVSERFFASPSAEVG